MIIARNIRFGLLLLVLAAFFMKVSVAIADDFEPVMQVLENYYQSQQEKDMEGYLATQVFSSERLEQRSRRFAEATWKSTSISGISLGPAQVAIKEDATEALVRFLVSYRIELKSSGDSFEHRADNVAMLINQNGWKIRRVSSREEFENIPQGVNENSYQQMAKDRDVFVALSMPPKSNATSSQAVGQKFSNTGVLTASAMSPGMSAPQSTSTPTNSPVPPASPHIDLNQGLLLSYDFTKSTGNERIEDLSGNGYSGTLNGPVWAGQNGLYFNGKNAHIKVDGGERLHSDKALTVIGEFITTSYAQKVWQNLFWKGNLPDGKGGAADCSRNCENREFALWLNSGAHLHATSTSKDNVGKGQTHFGSPGGSIVGKTTFAQVVDSSAKSMKIYINGKEAASQPYSSSGIRRTDGPLLIGGGHPIDKNWSFRGYLRWLRIYDRALTAAEIDAVARSREPEKAEPWRDPFLIDDVVVKGGWASLAPIQYDSNFADRELGKLKPGVDIQNGWFSTPTNRQETEAVYRHDGSPLRFSGHATVLDCIDYCGHSGSVEQIIRGDGQDLWRSGKLIQGRPGKDFEVDLTGVNEIRLITNDGGNGDGEDWAAWLNLELSWPEEKPTAFAGDNKYNITAFDFESGTLDNWEKTGSAFNSQPTLDDNPTARNRGQASNHQGRYWIGTFEKRPHISSPAGATQGDGPQGTLTSKLFNLCKEDFSFLVGGGCDVNTERVELIVDGAIVLQSTGSCSETMKRVDWNVQPWMGKMAQLRVVDQSSGGWGHINVDDFKPVCVESNALPDMTQTVVLEPLPLPKVKIVGSATRGGKVETIYTLAAKPLKPPLLSIKKFINDPEKIVTWFEYHGFETGDVLTGVWSDVGRQVKLREDPIVIMKQKGSSAIVLKRPVTGWANGRYLVEIKRGSKVLKKAEFQIVN